MVEENNEIYLQEAHFYLSDEEMGTPTPYIYASYGRKVGGKGKIQMKEYRGPIEDLKAGGNIDLIHFVADLLGGYYEDIEEIRPEVSI